MNLKKEAWHILNDPDDIRYRWFHGFINILILVSVALVFYEVIWDPDGTAFTRKVDQFILTVFVVEFVGRLWVIRDWEPKSVNLTPIERVGYYIKSRLSFIFSPWGFIDFVAILPIFPFLRSLRILRLLRLVRSVQFFRYSNPLRTLFHAFRDNSILFAVAGGFVVFCTVSAALMFFLAEFRANDGVNGLGDTLWWSIVTISTVGFGDITPVTGGGKVVGAALMFSGMFVIALFAGVISSTLVGHLMPLRQEQVRMSSISDHIIVAGWNDHVPMLLDEMEREYDDDLPQIIVFAPRDRPEGLDDHFLFVTGDHAKEAEYEKVRLKYARTVLVVASSADLMEKSAHRDASTVLTIFTIRSLEKKLADFRSEGLHVVAEILDPENYEHAVAAGADEVIETSRLGNSLLAHTTGNPGVGRVLTNLLMTTRNNVYATHIPPEMLEGESLDFEEFQREARSRYGVLVIGVVHDDDLMLNPDPEASVYVGDRVVYLGGRPMV